MKIGARNDTRLGLGNGVKCIIRVTKQIEMGILTRPNPHMFFQLRFLYSSYQRKKIASDSKTSTHSFQTSGRFILEPSILTSQRGRKSTYWYNQHAVVGHESTSHFDHAKIALRMSMRIVWTLMMILILSTGIFQPNCHHT